MYKTRPVKRPTRLHHTVPGSDLVTSKLKELKGTYKLNDSGQVTDKAGNVLANFKEGTGQLKRIAGKKVDIDELGNLTRKGKNLGSIEPVLDEENESDESGEALDDDSDEEEQSLEGCTIREDGKVVNDEDEVVGQVVEGSYKKLERLVGRKVTSDHTIVNKKGRNWALSNQLTMILMTTLMTSLMMKKNRWKATLFVKTERWSTMKTKW